SLHDALPIFPAVNESGLFDLCKIEFDWGGTAKNRDRYTHLAFLVIHFFDVAVEVCERTFLYANHLANLEQNLGTRLFHALFHLRQDFFDFLVGARRRSIAIATQDRKSDV